MSSSAISSHSSQPVAQEGSFSESKRIDLYEVDETKASKNLPDKEAQAEQRLFIQNKKKDLEETYRLLSATGRDALWISREMDYFLSKAYIATETNSEELKIKADKRRRTETAARKGLSADMSNAKADLNDFLARKQVSEKQKVTCENAVNKWRSELPNVPSTERKACSGLVNQFEQNLKESRNINLYREIPEKKGNEFLDREIAADGRRFEHRCPKQTEAQAYVEKVKETWAHGLTLAASDKKKACERQIEKCEKELDALQADRDQNSFGNISEIKYGPIPDVAEKYTKEIEKQCF